MRRLRIIQIWVIGAYLLKLLEQFEVTGTQRRDRDWWRTKRLFRVIR